LLGTGILYRFLSLRLWWGRRRWISSLDSVDYRGKRTGGGVYPADIGGWLYPQRPCPANGPQLGRLPCQNDWAYEGAEDVLETASGGFLAVGYESDNIGGPSFQGCKMIQMDGDGNKLWESHNNTYTQAKSAIAPQVDGTGFVVATDFYNLSSSGVDLLLFGIDETGSVLWERSYGDASTNQFMSLDQTNDDGYILAGNSVIEEKNAVLIVKVDSNGDF
jgi:hypothetical protein